MEREVGRGLGWGTHVHQWLIHVNVWQKPPQYCKVISLQLNKLIKKRTIFLFANDATDKGSISKIYKQSIQLNNLKKPK